MKRFIPIGAAFLIFGIIILFIVLSGWDKNIQFLKSYGWEVDKTPVEICEITIPGVFDEVYENYNILQLEAGLDLSPYCGMDAVRYTYILKNFPYEVNCEVRANVVTVDGEPIAGDIMTVGLGGFMYSLNFNEAVCFSISN